MSHRIGIRSAAARDIADARSWYEAQQPGLGRSFLDAIEQTLDKIAAGPQRYPVVTGDARRALIQKFPYSIYFRVRDVELRIIGVIHQHRDPRVWQRRAGSDQ